MYHAYKEISEPCIAALVAQTASAQFHRLVSTSDGFYNRQKILFILLFPKPCVYTWGIDVEMVGIDDRRIATGVLYERMKHRTGLSFGNMWTLIEGLRYTIRQQMKTVNIRKEVITIFNYPLVYPKHN